MDTAAGAPGTVAVGEDLVAGQSHQPITAMTSNAAAAAAIATRVVGLRRDASSCTLRAGKSATASGRNA